MIPTTSPYVGADVAQDTVAFCGLKTATVKNTSAQLRAYLGALPAEAHVVCEATGRHHHALQQACQALGRSLTVLNPAHARAYANSLGKLEKTDAIDAALLRRFGEERRPPATPAPSAEQRGLLDLLMLRSAVVEDISAYRHRQALLTPTAQTELAALLVALRARRLALERQLAAWLEAAPQEWRDRVQTLCLTVGIGTLSALQLLAYLPELGACNRRQVAKLAGLAPLPRDSGRMHGVRRIQHGRAPARRVLYQCAVVAARWNETLRPHYQQLRARGKPAKLAYVAVARKLLVYLNALLTPGPAATDTATPVPAPLQPVAEA
jgi:transposase